MRNFTHFCLLCCFCLFAQAISAQNLLVTFKNPDGLYVCGTDTFTVILSNNTATAATNVVTTVTLPNGVTYVPGSVTGGTENNISNLNAPRFNVVDVPANNQRSFNIVVKADCKLVEEINSGKLFSNSISAQFNGGGPAQATTSLYKIETGLLVFGNVTPLQVSGQKGDMVTRKVSITNTRQGPISSLVLSDQHQDGIILEIVGVGGNNVSNTFFAATIPGSYFKNFGDGDELLEVNETIEITQKITITRCATSSTTIQSQISATWGCDGQPCQLASTFAETVILPTTQNPALKFVPKYTFPLDQCGDEGTPQEYLIINEGPVEATSVTTFILSQDSLVLGIDPNSFEYNAGSGWVSVTGVTGKEQLLSVCNKTYLKLAIAKLPGVQPGDTLKVRFKTYFCAPVCYPRVSFLSAAYQYPKACPETELISGNFNFVPTPDQYSVKSQTEYKFGGCMANGGVYDFTWWIKSQRQTRDTGYLHVYFDLPWGIFWNNCPLIVDGKTPEVQITEVKDQYSTVHLTFKLPFSADSVGGKYCLRYSCEGEVKCGQDIPNVPPRGASYSVFALPPDCDGCDLSINAVVGFGTKKTTRRDCIISYCDKYVVVGEQCPGGGGGGGGGGGAGGLAVVSFNTYRTNVGLQDDNDDRKADSNQAAKSPNVRLDRFMVGDTMRSEMKFAVIEGSFKKVGFRLFTESWQSDFGNQDGDSYNFIPGPIGFFNYDTLLFIRASAKFKIAATGQTYTCPIKVPKVRSDRHTYTFASPNVRPTQAEDVILNMFDEYTLDMDSLALTGCVPGGLVLVQGDSLLFEADSKFAMNFTPPGGSVPPLINIRTSVCTQDQVYNWKLKECFPALLRQYTGYVENITYPTFNLKPCDPAEELSPFGYNLRLARGNLFPFEVRPVTRLTGFSHTLPNVVPLIEARLKYLQLQEDVQLFSDVKVNATTSGSTVSLDFASFFNPLLDEGWRLETNLKFGANCDITGDLEAVTSVAVNYANKCLRVKDKKLDHTYIEVNPNGYIDARPKLNLIPDNTQVFLPGSTLDLDFNIKNNAQFEAPNGWLVIDDGGALTDIKLIYLPSLQEVPKIGNVYQLGKLAEFSQTDFRLTAVNRSCEVVTLILRYGWDCNSVSNPGGTCGAFEKEIKLRPQSPELELVVTAQPDQIPMCVPSDFFEFEVYNANEGTASNVEASVKLPQGLRIIPGTSQLSFPTGSGWVNLPDPTNVSGSTVYVWEPGKTSPVLATDGLVGVSNAPKNTLKIRFKVEAICGFVSNSQIVYGAEAIQPCGALSNILRKPGPQVKLAGLSPSYNVQAQLGFTNPPGALSCGNTVSLTGTLIMGDTPNPGDSLYIILPTGTSYVAGSYKPGINAPAGPPQQNGAQLRLPLPATAAQGTTVKFEIQVRYDDPANCTDKIIVMQTREQDQLFCPSQNKSCSVFTATSEFLLTLNTQNPDLILNNFEPGQLNGNTLSFKAILKNEGNGAANGASIKFYVDTNGNGKLDAGEPLLQDVKISQTVAGNSSSSVNGTISGVKAEDLCRLIAVISGKDNCSCSDKTFPLGGQQTVTTGIGACSVAPVVNVGVDEVAGHSYQWVTTNGISDPTKGKVTYTPDPNQVKIGDVVTLILLDKSGTCTIERRFDIKFGGQIGIESKDQTICPGETVTLQATAGGKTYNWSGPGVNAGASEQVLNPTSTATYSVTVTFNDGCSGTGSVKVTVLPTITKTLPDLTTCKGNPVDVPGANTDVAGVYSKTFKAFNGCDSTVTQRLKVPNPEGFSSEPLCPGDTILVFGEKVSKSGIYSKKFSTTSGCDSTHFVTVKSVPTPTLPKSDSFRVEKGTEITLTNPTGYVSYTWTPTTGLSCSDCASPVAKPDSTTVYNLKVVDANGCENEVSYRVIVFPPCFGEYNIPNAFTPNGDAVNDVFRVVPINEGVEVITSMQVFDRWGRKVFEAARGQRMEWDGKVDDKPGLPDVYYYIITAECQGKTKESKGGIALLR